MAKEIWCRVSQKRYQHKMLRGPDIIWFLVYLQMINDFASGFPAIASPCNLHNCLKYNP